MTFADRAKIANDRSKLKTSLDLVNSYKVNTYELPTAPPKSRDSRVVTFYDEDKRRRAQSKSEMKVHETFQLTKTKTLPGSKM